MADATQRLLLLIDGKANGAKSAIDQTTKSVDAATKKIQASGNRISSFGKQLGSAFVALGAAAFLKKGVESAIKAEASTARLKNAVDQTGQSYASQEKAIKATIRAQSDLAAVGAGDLRSAMTALTQTTGSAAEAQKLLGITADLARAKNISLEASAKLVGKVAMGNTSALTRYGIVLEKGATASEALAAMQQKFGGAAEAYGKTTAGQMDLANIAIARLQTTIGTAMLPTVGRFATATADLLGKFADLPKGVQDATIAIGGISTAALIAAPYLTALGKGLTATATAAKAVVTWNAAASITSLGAAAGNAAASVALLAEGGSVTALIGMGGAAGIAAGAVTGLAVAASLAVGLGIGKLITMIPAANSALASLGTAISGTDEKFNAFERWIYGLDGGAVATTAVERAAMTAKPAIDGVGAATGAAGDEAAGAAGQTDQLTRAMNGAMVASDSLAGKERGLKEAELASKTAKLDVKAATEALAAAKKKSGAGSDEAKRAQINLTQAELRAKDAVVDLKTAQSDYAAKSGAAKAAAQALADKMDKIKRSANEAADALDKAYGAGAGAATRAAGSYGGKRASGSIDAPRPGGVNVVVAEAGDYEATIPINRSSRSMALFAETGRRLGLAAASPTPIVQKFYGSRIDADWMGEAARRALMTTPAPRIA